MLNELIAKYNSFILDIWGVVHDGKILIPGAEEFIHTLKLHNKNFCFLSNAPRPAAVTHKRFVDIGLNGIDINKITTSGDLFRTKVDEILGTKICILGEEMNTDLLAGIDISRATQVDAADFLLILTFGYSEADLMQHNDIFKQAIAKGIIMLCPNPDIIVFNNGKPCYTPGAFARIYENMGGKVNYYGKPHKEAYEYAFTKYAMDPKKTIMIGDSLETDIKGAANAEIDSLLVLTGIHSTETELDELYKRYNVEPTYVASNLRF